jgi:hypothetical protein
MSRSIVRLFAAAALVAAGLSLQGCVVLDTVNTGAKVVGTGVGAGARVVSSTGDVIFDHDGDGR